MTRPLKPFREKIRTSVKERGDQIRDSLLQAWAQRKSANSLVTVEYWAFERIKRSTRKNWMENNDNFV